MIGWGTWTVLDEFFGKAEKATRSVAVCGLKRYLMSGRQVFLKNISLSGSSDLQTDECNSGTVQSGSQIDKICLCHQWVTVAVMAAVPGVEDGLSVESTF